MVNRLRVTRVKTMGIVKSAAIGPFEMVFMAKDAVVIGRVCYVVTQQDEKLDDNEY